MDAPWRLAVGLTLRWRRNPSSRRCSYASLTGTVTERQPRLPFPAPLSGSEHGTGVVKAVATNQEGIYLVGDLHPGVYKITIRNRGVAPFVQEA